MGDIAAMCGLVWSCNGLALGWPSVSAGCAISGPRPGDQRRTALTLTKVNPCEEVPVPSQGVPVEVPLAGKGGCGSSPGKLVRNLFDAGGV